MSKSINYNLEIKNPKGKLPSLPFDLMKMAVLGQKYELSLAFVESKEIKFLNKIYRGINKPTDILSFPLAKNQGEILICLTETKKMMKEFNLPAQAGRSPYENFLAFLFLHGLIHLKGYDHGAEMEKIEIKFRKKFKI